jgi:hypothetical protein
LFRLADAVTGRLVFGVTTLVSVFFIGGNTANLIESEIILGRRGRLESERVRGEGGKTCVWGGWGLCGVRM